MVFRNHWRYRFGIILMLTFLTIKMEQYQSPYQKVSPINQSECSMFKFEKMIHFIDTQMRFKLKSSNKFQFFIHQIFYLLIHHFLLMIVIWRRIGHRKWCFSENSNFSGHFDFSKFISFDPKEDFISAQWIFWSNNYSLFNRKTINFVLVDASTRSSSTPFNSWRTNQSESLEVY